jgi:hypothetical protein
MTPNLFRPVIDAPKAPPADLQNSSRFAGKASDHELAPTEQSRPTKVLIIAPAWIPSVIVGILNPLEQLERRGELRLRLKPAVASFVTERDIAWCDVVVFCRACQISDLRWLYAAKRRHKRVIYDIDDNFEEIPLTTRLGVFHRAFFRLHVVRRFYALADITRVYSPRMQQLAQQHGARVRLERSYFDASIIAGRVAQRREGMIRIAYPSGRIDEPQLERMLYEAMRQVLLRYSGRVELHLWRKLPRPLLGVPGVVLHRDEKGYKKFVRDFHDLGCDIGVAPLLDEPFYHSKTNTKYRELGGCGVAGVYSNTAPYVDCVVDGRNGLLVDNTVEAWVGGITRLIDEPDLGADIARRARLDVLSNYAMGDAVRSFQSSIRESLEVPFQPCDWIYAHDVMVSVALVTSRQPAIVEVDKWPLDRPKLLAKAVAALRGELYKALDAPTMAVRPDVGQQASVVVFLVDCGEDLVAAIELLKCCNSAIFDLTRLDIDAGDLSAALRGAADLCPLRLIVANEQTMLIAIARELNLPCLTISRASALQVETSVASYPAAYLDGIERHIRFGTKRRQFRVVAAVLNRSKRAVALLGGCLHRLEQLWYFGRWMLGGRPL